MAKNKSSKSDSKKSSKKSSEKKSESSPVAKSNGWAIAAIALGVLFFISMMGNAVLGTMLYLGDETSGEVQAPSGQTAPNGQEPAPSEPVEVAYEDAPLLGDADAPIVLVEFSDYECPFCARFYSQTLPQIKENYIDTGIAQLRYRDFPLSFHQRAIPAAIAARCVGDQLGDEGYFAMHDQLFENQNDLSDSALRSYAVEVGADGAQFDTCYADEDGSKEAAVQQDMSDGQAAGVSGTPTVFVNGQKIVGAQPYAAFEAAIEAARE